MPLFARHLAAFCCFALSMAGTCRLLGHTWPRWGSITPLQEKLAHLRAHPAEYDTLFFGSSRVHRHFDPALFDALTAAAGQPTRSFNAGMDALFAPEDGYLAELLFAVPFRGLKRVFLEVGTFIPATLQNNPGSNRGIAWHDGPRTAFITREMWRLAEEEKLSPAKRSLPKKKKKMPRWQQQYYTLTEFLPEILPHWVSWCVNEANVGRGAALVAPLFTARDGRPKYVPGFEPLGPAGNGFSALHGFQNEASLQAFRELLAARQTTPTREKPLDEEEQANLEHIIRLIRARGAEVILVVPPNPAPITELPSRPVHARVIDFTDDHRWPELFREGSRYDQGHLNNVGAEAYTRAFVQEWLAPAGPLAWR